MGKFIWLPQGIGRRPKYTTKSSCFLAKEGSITIKLIEPSSQDSSIFLFARKGGGLHHLCFRCGKLETQILILRQKGVKCIAPPEPGEAFENNDIAFLLAGNLNIELIDTDKKKGWVSTKE